MSPDRSSRLEQRGKKLALDQVRAIAECIAAGERHAAVAKRFGVSVETVGAIKSGKRWADRDRRRTPRQNGSRLDRHRPRCRRRPTDHGGARSRTLWPIDRRGVRHQPQHGQRDQARSGMVALSTLTCPRASPSSRSRARRSSRLRSPRSSSVCSRGNRRAKSRRSSACRHRRCWRSRGGRRGRRLRREGVGRGSEVGY